MEVTGKNQDECMVALHDCNEDVNRAINFLLESTSDTVGTASPPLLLLLLVPFDLIGHSLTSRTIRLPYGPILSLES